MSDTLPHLSVRDNQASSAQSTLRANLGDAPAMADLSTPPYLGYDVHPPSSAADLPADNRSALLQRDLHARQPLPSRRSSSRPRTPHLSSASPRSSPLLHVTSSLSCAPSRCEGRPDGEPPHHAEAHAAALDPDATAVARHAAHAPCTAAARPHPRARRDSS
ncbi:hypothetical protein HWV62_18814 [Athelia sp. TMB]|nr:hypothetical protein HWV62_18814 [Athelia sp. TMB]